jgi:O-antigen ligase
VRTAERRGAASLPRNGLPGRTARWRPTGALAPFLPAALVLAIWIVFIPLDGGYFPSVWYPAAILSVALLAAVAFGARRWWPAWRPAGLALGLLIALAVWSFASMLWAVTKGDAWDASNQWLLYLAMAWLVALVPWRPRPAYAFLGVWAFAMAVVCAGELLSALGASHLEHFFLEARWQQPTGYANAAAATGAMACWPALMLASRRGVPAWLQVVFLAVAVFLVEFALLPQSRAALIAVVPALVVFVALSPDRARAAVRLAIVAVALAIAGGPIWHVFGVGEAARPLRPALQDATRAMLLSIAVAVVAGTLVAIAERRFHPSARVRLAGHRGAIAAAVCVAIAAAGLAVARGGDATTYIGDRWADFTSNKEQDPDPNPSRIFQRTSDKRYDYWRVSVAMFRDAPVGGVGAGGFERVYTQERLHPKPSRSAHSIWMRSIGETGAVGTALLVALVAVLAAGLLRARRRLDDRGRAIVAACAAVGTYFAIHASFDWLELIPALAAPAIALPFLGLGLAAPAPVPEPAAERSRVRLPGWLKGLVGGVLAVAAVLSLAAPYASVRYVDAARTASSDPAVATRDFSRAAWFNPLSAEPRIAAGQIAVGGGRYADASREFEQALEVEDGWYPHFELALLHSRGGRFARARREIAVARALNPPDLLLKKASDLIAERKRLDPRRVNPTTLALPLYKKP